MKCKFFSFTQRTISHVSMYLSLQLDRPDIIWIWETADNLNKSITTKKSRNYKILIPLTPLAFAVPQGSPRSHSFQSLHYPFYQRFHCLTPTICRRLTIFYILHLQTLSASHLWSITSHHTTQTLFASHLWSITSHHTTQTLSTNSKCISSRRHPHS